MGPESYSEGLKIRKGLQDQNLVRFGHICAKFGPTKMFCLTLMYSNECVWDYFWGLFSQNSEQIESNSRFHLLSEGTVHCCFSKEQTKANSSDYFANLLHFFIMCNFDKPELCVPFRTLFYSASKSTISTIRYISRSFIVQDKKAACITKCPSAST